MKIYLLFILCLCLSVPVQAQLFKNGTKKAVSVVKGFTEKTSESIAGEKNLASNISSALRRQAVVASSHNFKALGPIGIQMDVWLNQEYQHFYNKPLTPVEDISVNRTLYTHYRNITYVKTAELVELMKTRGGVDFLKRNIRTEFVDRIDYTRLIPASAKIIYVGELHNHLVIYKELESMISQYMVANPGRKVFLLAEAISSDMPTIQIASETGFAPFFDHSAASDKQNKTFFNIVELGAKLGGLEQPGVMRLLMAQNPVTSMNARDKYSSLVWVTRRNRNFKKQIDKILTENPDAVVFAYGGKAHFNYALPYCVPNLVQEKRAVVFDFSLRMHEERVALEGAWTFWQRLMLEDEAAEFGSAVRQVTNPKVKWLFGSDIKIEVEQFPPQIF